MDASIMDGATLAAGGVTLVREVKNPVSLARHVLDSSSHVLLAGPGASEFARAHGVPIVSPQDMISEYARHCMDEFLKNGGNHSVSTNN